MGTAAEPVLASSLWSPQDSKSKAARRRLATNNEAIDAALEGGLDYGRICCISGEADTGTRDITQALLASHLLGSSDAHATVIDTGQAVDVRQLYHDLTARLGSDGDASVKAKEVLSRLRITKIFDFEGLSDGVSEVREVLEGRSSETEGEMVQEQPPRGTVADSQAEEEEMLDPPTPPVKPAPAPAQSPETASTKPGLLIIDNITQNIAPILKSNHASGQALLTSFMRSLSHLTRTHDLYTVIVNSTISNKYAKDESPSAFASCPVQPALGRTFTYLLDTHLLVHQMSIKGKDVRAAHGVQRANGDEALANVVEVGQDRYGGRVGRWAAFYVQEGGRLMDFS